MGSLASPAKGRAFTACLLFFSSQCYYIRNKMWVGSLIRALPHSFPPKRVNHGSVVKQKKSMGWLVGCILPFSVTPMHRTSSLSSSGGSSLFALQGSLWYLDIILFHMKISLLPIIYVDIILYSIFRHYSIYTESPYERGIPIRALNRNFPISSAGMK